MKNAETFYISSEIAKIHICFQNPVTAIKNPENNKSRK